MFFRMFGSVSCNINDRGLLPYIVFSLKKNVLRLSGKLRKMINILFFLCEDFANLPIFFFFFFFFDTQGF